MLPAHNSRRRSGPRSGRGYRRTGNWGLSGCDQCAALRRGGILGPGADVAKLTARTPENAADVSTMKKEVAATQDVDNIHGRSQRPVRRHSRQDWRSLPLHESCAGSIRGGSQGSAKRPPRLGQGPCPLPQPRCQRHPRRSQRVLLHTSLTMEPYASLGTRLDRTQLQKITSSDT